MKKKISKFPLVVICGGTGTGKSKLAIEIAKYYNGEVINADALQIYKGLNIATNKVSLAECMGVKHHLLGFESLETLDYTVHDFQKAALDKIYELKKDNKMPVLVGGTNYYIESILWETLVDVNGNISSDTIKKLELMDNNELHNYLSTLDPQSADLLHPNSRRKIIRAIEIAQNSSFTLFDHIECQTKSRRFKLNDTVFIWVNSELDSLYLRLDKRVDEMIVNGLMQELDEIQLMFLRLCPRGEYTRGIFQAIGFKEFHQYLNLPDKESDGGKKVLKECIERLKVANKQYVRVQNKWIKNRFLRAFDDERNIPLFKVDSTDVSKWNENVLQHSINIIEDVMHSTEETHYDIFIEQLKFKPEKLKINDTCTPCKKVCVSCNNQLFITLQTWNAHLKSRKHEKVRKRLRKAELYKNCIK